MAESEELTGEEEGESPKRVPQTLYEVLDATCKTEHIQKLLRKYKDQGFEDIRIGGATKADIVKNVQEAVAAKIIPEADVLTMIRDHEESGNQHILYFRPKDEAAAIKLADGMAIGKKIFGKDFAGSTKPNYETKQGEYVWAEFRTDGIDTRWTAKIYGHQVRIYFRRQEERDGTVIRYYDVRERRIVCLAHWNGREFEMRIGRVGSGTSIEQSRTSQSEREIDRRVNILASFLAPAKISDFLEPWDLAGVQKKMLQAVLNERERGIRSADTKLSFVPVSARFRDSAFGTAEFNSHDDAEDVATADERLKAIKVYLSGKKSNCRQLVVNWDAVYARGLWGEKPLRSIIGGGEGNEIVIASGVDSRTVSYVTNQLHSFAK